MRFPRKTDLFSLLLCMNVIEILCLKGLHLDLARYVVLQTYKGCGFDALDKGQEWLFSCEDFYPLKDAEKTWNACAANGLLHMLKLLHKYGIEGCTTETMALACAKGDLDIVIWLHENRSEGCSTWAMNYAASEGHLEVVKWLHENRNEGYEHPVGE